MRVRKSDCHHEMILPDRFTTRLPVPEGMLTAGTGQESEWLTGTGTQAVSRPWLHVGIVSDDFIMVTALRWLLTPLSPVRLRVWKTGEEAGQAVLTTHRFRPDVMIWADGAHGRPEPVRHILTLSRRCPWLRQLCLSGHVPPSLGGLLRGVRVVSEMGRPGEIIRELEACARQETSGQPLLAGPPLTAGQWVLLRYRASGCPSRRIAEQLRLKPKTLASRYYTLMQLLKLHSRTEQTWLLRHLPQVLAAAPGLTRLRRRQTRRGRPLC